MHVTFCEYLVNLDGTCTLLFLLSPLKKKKKVLQVYFFSSPLYTVFPSIEAISRDESGGQFSIIVQICFALPVVQLTYLTFHSSKDHSEMVPNKTQYKYLQTRYNVLNTLLNKVYPISLSSPNFAMRIIYICLTWK